MMEGAAVCCPFSIKNDMRWGKNGGQMWENNLIR